MLLLIMGGYVMSDNRFQKSALDAVTLNDQILTADGLLEFDSNNVWTGRSIFHNAGANVRLLKAGLYLVTVGADVLADAAGEVTLQLLNNNIEVPGAQATYTATATATEHLSFEALIHVPLSCCSYSTTTANLTVTISADATVSNAHIVVAKLA